MQQDNIVLSGRKRMDSAMVVIRPVGLPNSRDTIPIRPVTNQVLFLLFQGHHKLLIDNI
jgi:hypothetical protein